MVLIGLRRVPVAIVSVAVLASAGLAAGPARPAVALQATSISADDVDLRPATAAEILDAVERSAGDVVLVNMWATWCQPCRAEFPGIVRLYRTYRDRGLEVIFVSTDMDEDTPAVREFLAEQGVDFPSYLKVGKDMEFIDGFEGGWTGLLPATFVYDGEGTLRHFWEGEASYETFEKRVLDVLYSPSNIHPVPREEAP